MTCLETAIDLMWHYNQFYELLSHNKCQMATEDTQQPEGLGL